MPPADPAPTSAPLRGGGTLGPAPDGRTVRALLGPAARRLAPRRVGSERDAVVFEVAAGALDALGGVDGLERVAGAPTGRARVRVPRAALAAPTDDGALALLVRVERATATASAHHRPAVWGVLNATPDSFSDGGRYATVEAAVRRGLELEEQGADVIDVGGESTRPGAEPVDERTETRRVLPVVEALAERLTRALISIDTMKAGVARAAVERGAAWVNDPSGGDADPAMLDAVGASGARYVCMHMRGTPRTMQVDPRYDDAPAEVCEELRAKLARALDAGIEPERLAADPGLGFGKRRRDSLALIARLGELHALGVPLLVGASRKSFVGALTGVAEPSERLSGSLAAACLLAERGAAALRVHDVRPTVEALAFVGGVLDGGAEVAG